MVVASAIFVMPTSCKKWLKEEPYSLYASDTFFKTTDEADMAVLGVYQQMTGTAGYGFYMSMVFDIDTDIAQMQGTALSDGPRQVAHYGIPTAHSYMLDTWRQMYRGINRANLVIEKVPQMDLYKNGTDAQKAILNKILGEAKFLRGQYYFDLVRLFGDVPMKLKSTEATDDVLLPRTDRYEIYTQIIKDMTEAAALIPENSAKSKDERLSKGAVKGMLARVALFAGGWSLRQSGQMERPSNYKEYYAIAQKMTSEVMGSGEHALNTSYEQIFKNHCKFILEPKESMYEVALFNATGGAGNSGVVGTWNAPIADAGNPYGRANSFYKTTALFQKSYKTGDLRRDVAVCTYKLDVAGNQVPQLTGRLDEGWAPGKWRRDWQNTGPKDLNNTDINWTLLRYADVLLMRAEAENELNEGPNAAAYDAINQVRRRAYGKPLNTADATVDLPAGLNKSDFFERVKQERAWELCFEGMRRMDLIRWNILGTSIRATQAALKAYRSNYAYVAADNFKDNKNELYPIPQIERDLNTNLSQNPKY
ncbi:Starch-binding associating with outer membrane [Pedobacter africanus]|uniref:Starch-binding associating with outer membrane n=2 Tax=Pedobacter africanus TaxID=151894 RepID=A0A1W1YVB6_9SPHI|nr:Starch-binding associating with outer membrane [Pedobacter africanus]